MPAPVDPKNVYAGHGRRHVQPRGRRATVARLFAQPHHRQGRRDRPRDLHGGRQPRRHSEPAAHRAVLGPADAVGVGRHQLSRRPCRRDADRPEDGPARQGDRRARFLQHVFHPRRQVGDPGRRGDAAARIPRSAHDGAPGLHRHAEMFRDQPRRFLARRLLRDLHLRIRQRARQDRSRPSHARRDARPVARPYPAGHPRRP